MYLKWSPTLHGVSTQNLLCMKTAIKKIIPDPQTGNSPFAEQFTRDSELTSLVDWCKETRTLMIAKNKEHNDVQIVPTSSDKFDI